MHGARVTQIRPGARPSRPKPLGSGKAQRGILSRVTIIKINAITVPPESGDELGRRFAARAGAVDQQDGFQGFELLRPTDDRTTWLVVTRWRTRPRSRPGSARRPSATATRGPAPAAESATPTRRLQRPRPWP
jgi:heme-degrading monooxygenase HmoA